MHAFLFVGQTDDNFNTEISKLAKKLQAKVIDYTIQKIDDVRSLNDLVRLSFNDTTLIVSKNINTTSEEALNAFLKNLEEPQENINFVLTAPSEKSVLSTIVSRCQVIKVLNTRNTVQNGNPNDFLKKTKAEQLSNMEKLKDRGQAIEFIQSLISYSHSKKDFSNMEILLKTLVNLKKNGNVSLHLTNLVARMESTHAGDTN